MLQLLLALSLGGCVHKVRVESEPPGATVFFKGKRVGVTPTEFTTVWTPHVSNQARRYRLRVVLPDHRPVVTTIGPEVRLWRYLLHPLRAGIGPCFVPPFEWAGGQCLKPRSSRGFVLVRDHGPAGTWTPEDAQTR
jgi:hypothetical protein